MSKEPTSPLLSHAITVVIPAHNEQQNISQLLTGLVDGSEAGEVDIIVVCNGCTDRTAEVARGFGPPVRVIELAVASKRSAQHTGDAAAGSQFPRAYIDADVLMSIHDLRRLVAPLTRGSVLAIAPTRIFNRHGVSPVVSRYYGVWERLPQVRSGLFGRGAVVVSATGFDRICTIPQILSDDLAMSEAFTTDERCVADDAHVEIRLPRTVRDLVRRRVRVATGNVQVDQLGLRKPGNRTSVGTLLRLVWAEPQLAPHLPAFILITAMARIRSRRQVAQGDFNTWLRDESSRSNE